MAVELGNRSFADSKSNGVRFAVRPEGTEGFTNRDWMYSGMYEEEVEQAIERSQLGKWMDGINTSLHPSDQTVLREIPHLLANAFTTGAAERYTGVLNEASKTSGESSTVFWGFKGVKSAILQDGSIRMAAGVLLTRAADFSEDNEFGEKFRAAGEKLLLIADIPQFPPTPEIKDKKE